MQQFSAALKNAIQAGNPQRVLLKFGNDEFSNEDIVISKGLDLREEFNSEQELTIGLAPSYTVSFSMLNDEGQLNNFNFGWFTAYLGARIDSGTPTEVTRTFTENGQTVTYAFAPLGTFFAERPKVVAKKMIDVTAHDQMTKFEAGMPSFDVLGITLPTTIGTIFQKMCQYLNVQYATLNFLNHDLDVSAEPVEDLKNTTMRQVLMWIAECACANARFNRDSQLEFAWLNNTSEVYTESNYSEFTPVWYETQQVNGLYCRDNTLYEETANGDLKTNNYLIQDNPFLCKPFVNAGISV